MKKDYYTASEAAAWLSKHGEPISEADVHRCTEAGQLPVCFQYRGRIGAFPPLPQAGTPGTIPGAALFPRPVGTPSQFAGYLRALNSPELGVITETLTTKKIDGKVYGVAGKTKTTRMTPRRVEIVTSLHCIPGLQQIKGGYVGRVTDDGALDFSSVPVAEWLFHADDLTALRPAKAKPTTSRLGSVHNQVNQMNAHAR